jgi:hypothetical protein
MTLRHIDTKETWKGERIDGIAHPRNIEQLWTTEQLAAIGLEVVPPPEPAPPSTDPADYPLEPFQFYAMLEIIGSQSDPARDLEAEILAAIDAIPDLNTKAVARAKLKHTSLFHRDNPLFAQIAPTLGMNDAEIDAAWMQAKGIS